MNDQRPATRSEAARARRRDLRTDSVAAPRSRSYRHAGSRPGHMLRNICVAVVGLLAFAATFGGVVYAQLQGNVDALDVGGLVDQPTGSDGQTLPPPADPNAGTALNILIIGSDSRSDGGVDDGFTSVLADTHIVAHISADRDRVELVSIPRDIMVDIPQCRTTSGETIPPHFGLYNEAFAFGWQRGGDKESAVACDINLAQATTGLTMDGFVLVEMGGFIEMVDALGGIDICIPEDIDVPKANLVLEAGQQTLDGEQALGYARARVGIDDGTDPSRIKRQQHLMSAMVDEILSRNVLTDGPALYQMLNAALGSLTVSSNMSDLTDAAGLALSLRSLDAADITFRTTPYGTYQPDPNRLVFTSEVDAIWAAMAADEPIPSAGSPTEEKPPADDQATDDATAPSGATTEPPSDPTTEPSADTPSSDPTTDDPTTEPTPTDPVEAGTAGANADDLNPVC